MWILNFVHGVRVYLFAADTMVPVRFTLCATNVILEAHGGALREQSANTTHFQEALSKNRVASLWNHICTNSEIQIPLGACDVDGLDVCVQTTFVVCVGVRRTSHGARLDRCRDVDMAEIDFSIRSAQATLHCYAERRDPPRGDKIDSVCTRMTFLYTHGHEFRDGWRAKNTGVGGIVDRSAHKLRMFVEQCVVMNPCTQLREQLCPSRVTPDIFARM